jgi:hypothetical protein
VPAPTCRWLLLIHQIPPHPAYLRVKVGRRLQSLGAVAVKNSVYVLPRSDQALEDLQWVRRAVIDGAGEATVCEARFVEGLSDAALEAIFNAARDSEYAAIAKDARALSGLASRRARSRFPAVAPTQAALARLRKRLAEAAAIDFFGAAGRDAVERALAAIEATIRPPATPPPSPQPMGDLRNRTWVTRSGVQVDRIASAWLIRRFVDPGARFELVPGHGYSPAPGELRFDMFEGEFTHEGDECTFEVLRRRFDLADAALRHIAEIVHDVDLKDGKFARPEAAGLAALLAGIAMRNPDDEARFREGAALFESLYSAFGGKR